MPQKPIDSIEDLKACLLNAKAFRRVNNRPFITISYAQSVDGSIAARNRQPIHLSGPESSALTHQIRAYCDAILVGIGTVLADDPRLTVRLAKGINPQPIILDTHLRTPPNAKLVKRSDPGPWIINETNSREDRTAALKKAGAKPISCVTAHDGKIDLCALMAMLSELKINSIMVEGGAQVITSFINSRLVDQFIITVSPRLVGGLQVIDSKGLNTESNLTLDRVSYQHLGDDLIMWARPVWKD
ncbi:MAG: RibD family protein [Desulfobacterales bacterium]|nr:RibD family protein [Desulfobacterales bacterium]